MRILLLTALSAHLASSVLVVGTFFMLLLAGPSRAPTARRWEGAMVVWGRLLLLVALGSGIVWLLVRTALFEGRAQAALEPRAVLHAVLDTWPGLIWLARHGILVILAAFLAIRSDLTERRDWIAARVEALALGALALALMSASSHAAAISPGTALTVAIDACHLLGTGVWLGGLVALGALLRAASRDADADDRAHAVMAARRFSRVALVAMLALMGSGVLNALAQVENIAALVGTPHGRLLLAKVAVLVPILGLAAVNRRRLLPALPGPEAMRRLVAFVGVEAMLALVLLVLAAAMTLTTPARHAEPVWPLPVRLSLDTPLEASASRWRALLSSQLAVLGAVALIASFFSLRRRAPLLAGALALAAVAAAVGLPPFVVDAYPTTYRRPLRTYHATSIASGSAIYWGQCAACHHGTPADLRSASTSRRHAGELFWLVSHGRPERGMPAFENRLEEAQRWDVINFIRALGTAAGSKSLGAQVQLDGAWLIAPDFTIFVGPLAPGALRDYRGRRMVLLVLYTLPGSRARISELARKYNLLSTLGVEIIAVPMQTSADAIRELGASPPVLFPVVTDGNAAIIATYGMFASGPHAELLIDRQGYVRAIWRDDTGEIQVQVERLNEEKSVPPFPDDHVH